MCKKLICVASLVVILGLAGSASAALVAHWKFNNDAMDSVGTLTWTLNGGAAFSTDTKEGSHSLSLDGVDDYAGQTAVGTLINAFSTKTVALWFKANTTSGTQVLYDEGGTTRGLCIRVNNGNLETAVREASTQVTASTSFSLTTWTHVAATFDNGALKLYVHGAEQASASASFTTATAHSNAAGIGARNAQDSFGGTATGDYFGGLIDDVRVYDNVLSAPEIAEMSGGYPKAYNPIPADGTMHLDTWVSLSWTRGTFAVSHDVYLGDNFNDVNNGVPETFRGNQTATFYVAGIPGFAYRDGLVPGTTYYWRIDEVNPADPNSPWKGDIWSFYIPSKKAYDEAPLNGSQFVKPDAVTLSWTGGLKSKLHHVYFGQDAAEVEAGTGSTYKGPATGTTYNPGPLARGTTYYWRIDEFDGAVTNKGDLWSFRTIPVMAITDPNLVGWWKLDEGLGATAADYSGYDHHGTLQGALQWVEGYDLGAIEWDGSGADIVEATGYDGVTGTHSRTVTAWFKTSTLGEIVSWGQNVAGQKWIFRVQDSDGQVGAIRIEVNGGYQIGSTDVRDGQWHHAAAVLVDDGSPDAIEITLYVDGQPEAISAQQSTGINTAAGVLRIGESPWHNRPFTGQIDDVRIYNKAMTQQEVQLVMRIDPLLAWEPSPKNGSTPDIEKATPLTWSRGDKASQHDVYFGTDKNAVANADSSAAGIYRGRQSATSYTPPEGVEWGGGPYYWRIDENNNDGTVTKGRVWSFTVADFILVDDFESYDAGNNQIWYSWHDGLGYGAPGTPPYFAGNGTGAAVGDENTASYTEETIVHGGDQSMPLSYDNNKQGFAKYSEAELTLTAPRDWSKYGIGELSLWFRGYPASVGSFVEAPAGTYTMTGAGTDIWGTADQFHYAFKMLTGAGSIVAKVESVANTNAWAKAGVMIRETLDAGSKHAFACVTPGNGVASQGRTDTDTASFSTNQTGLAAPYWVKLERDAAGNFTASHSANGTTWQPVQNAVPQNIPMTSVVYVGLALTSHDAALTCQAKFSNVTITGTVSGQWTHQDIGIASNAAERLYVALSNSAGSPAVVVHDDANAATTTTWTEWIIPLQKFADQGINLKNVDRIAIGLGTRGNMTTPGGSGKMFFDDIRLYRPRSVP